MENAEVFIGRDSLRGQARPDRPTLLVVDDDLVVAEVGAPRSSHSLGLRCGSGSKLSRRVGCVAAHGVDGIVLDMHMPVMGGRAMLDELRWLGYPTPVLMMSAGSDESALRQLAKEGAQGFLTKPFSLLALQKLYARVFEFHGVGVSINDHF